MIQHDLPDAKADEAFIFSSLGGFASICAPLSWPQDRIERFAGTGWTAVDIADVIGGQLLRYRHTPNPCDQAPTLRQHWFLVRSP